MQTRPMLDVKNKRGQLSGQVQRRQIAWQQLQKAMNAAGQYAQSQGLTDAKLHALLEQS